MNMRSSISFSFLLLFFLLDAYAQYPPPNMNNQAEQKQSAAKNWHIVDGYDLPDGRTHSRSFSSLQYGNYSCLPVQCSTQELDKGFGYFMAATAHTNTFEMLVFRVCRYFQTCIRHQHIFVTLHHKVILQLR